jgi:PPK2 family polyphosphate:nucleotide phosphotransferase
MSELGVSRKRRFRLDRVRPDDTTAFRGNRAEAESEMDRWKTDLGRLQELLYADHQRAILIVLQGMDAAGKDGVIRHVFDGTNPQGVDVASFKQPTPEELDHDFLWRVHAHTPAKGHITIFNRSHYEDVLAVRVHHLVPRAQWERRFRSINEFERDLVDEGTIVLKFFLHISREEQRSRLEERLRDRTKRWKLTPADLRERRFWVAYQHAYEEVLDATNTEWAPWFVIPSNHKWFRNWAVSKLLLEALERLDLRYPRGLVRGSTVRFR